MQRFGALPSSTTLAIQVTLTTTEMMRRCLARSGSFTKTVSPTVPSCVRFRLNS